MFNSLFKAQISGSTTAAGGGKAVVVVDVLRVGCVGGGNGFFHINLE